MSLPEGSPPPVCARCKEALAAGQQVEHRGAVYCMNCIGRALNGETTAQKESGAPGLIERARQALDSEAAKGQWPYARNPTHAVLLSLLPGLGQMYNGQMAKGVVVMVAFFALASTLPPLVVPLYFWNLFDAYWGARAVGEPGSPVAPSPFPLAPEIPFPPAAAAQDWPQSPTAPAWGVLLIVLGILFLLNNFGITWLTWDRLWPATLLCLGIWLLVSFMLSRRRPPAPEPAAQAPAEVSHNPLRRRSIMTKRHAHHHPNGTGTLVFGIIFTILGGGLLVQRTTGVDVWRYLWRLWPLLLIVMGVKVIADHYRSASPPEEQP